MGDNVIKGVLISERKKKEGQCQGRYDDKSRGWSNAVAGTSQGAQAATRKWKR